MSNLLLANALVNIVADGKHVKAELGEVERELGRTLTTVEGKFADGFKRGMDDAAGATEMLGGKLGAVTAMLSSPALLAGAGAAAIGAGLTVSAKSAAAFEAKWANVTTLFNTSEVNANALREELMRMPNVLGDIADLTEGMYQALSSGVEPAQAVAFVGEAAQLARAGLAGMYETVDVLTTVLNAYGMSADQAGRVSDVLFKTVEQGKTILPELAGKIGTVIPFAVQLGVSIEEVGAAMATLTKGGLNTDIAATALRGALVAFIQQADKFRAVGYDILQIIREEGLAGGMRVLGEISQGNMEIVREMVPDVRGLTAILALGGKQAGEFAKQIGIMGNAAGATGAAFRKQANTTEAAMKALSTSLEKLAITVGNALLPPLAIAAEMLADMTDKAARFFSFFQGGGHAPDVSVLDTIRERIADVDQEMRQVQQSLDAFGLGTALGEQVDDLRAKLLALHTLRENLYRGLQVARERAAGTGTDATEAEREATKQAALQKELQIRRELNIVQQQMADKSMTLDESLQVKRLENARAWAEASKAGQLDLLAFDTAILGQRAANEEAQLRRRIALARAEKALLQGSDLESAKKRAALDQSILASQVHLLAARANAEHQLTLLTRKEHDARLKMEDHAFAARKAMGQVSMVEELERLQRVANDERRTIEERLKANQDAFQLAQEWATRTFAHRQSMGLVSLGQEIAHYRRVAEAATTSAEHRMQAEERVYRKEIELREKRRSAAATILEEVQTRLDDKGVTDITMADLQQEFAEMNRERATLIGETGQRFAQGGRVDLDALKQSLAAARSLEESGRAIHELGPLRDIVAGGLTPGPLSAQVRSEMGLVGGVGAADDLSKATPEDQTQRARMALSTVSESWRSGLALVEAEASASVGRILARIDEGASETAERLYQTFKVRLIGDLRDEAKRS